MYFKINYVLFDDKYFKKLDYYDADDFYILIKKIYKDLTKIKEIEKKQQGEDFYIRILPEILGRYEKLLKLTIVYYMIKHNLCYSDISKIFVDHIGFKKYSEIDLGTYIDIELYNKNKDKKDEIDF